MYRVFSDLGVKPSVGVKLLLKLMELSGLAIRAARAKTLLVLFKEFSEVSTRRKRYHLSS